MSGWSCANEVQWVNDKTGPGRCAKWCGDRAKCISTIPGKPLPEYEVAPHFHLTEAVWKLLSCYDKGVMDKEVRRLAQPLIDYRDRLHAEAKGEPPPAVERSEVDATINQAIEALEMAKTGLMWYRGLMPNYVDGSDEEADDQIGAAIDALRKLGPRLIPTINRRTQNDDSL